MRSPVAMWIAAVLASALAFVVHLTLKFALVRVGYDLGRAVSTQKQLIENKRLLSLEAVALRQTQRVRQQALAMGLKEAPTHRVVNFRATKLVSQRALCAAISEVEVSP